MPLTLRGDARAALETAPARSRTVRHWRRSQAVWLRADGVPVASVAQTVDWTETSSYNWVAAWRAAGGAGVAAGVHPGTVRRLDPAAAAALETLLTQGDPQAHGYAATGWTVPLLRTALGTRGGRAGERTIRRTLHRLGWRWKRPTFVLGRPDPAYTEKKSRRPASGSHGGSRQRGVVRR
jgi:transposase